MKREDFFPLQEVLGTDLERLEEAKEQAIVERNRDLFSKGILLSPQLIIDNGIEYNFSGAEFPITFTNPGPGSHILNIGKGIAYSRLGERIIINSLVTFSSTNPATVDSEGNATPQSTGSQSITTLSQGDNYLYIEYLQTVDTSVFFPDPITGLRHYTKLTDGYQIGWVTVPELDPAPILPVDSIFLGKVTVDVNLNVTAVDTAERVYTRVESEKVSITIDVSNQTSDYTDGLTTDLNAHVNAIGEGTPTPNNPHGMGINDVEGLVAALAAATAEPLVESFQKESHSNGIYSNDQTNTASNLTPAIVSGSFSGAPAGTLAYVQFRKLAASGQAVYVNGKRTELVIPTATSLSDDVYVSFVDADATATYSLFIEQTGSDFTMVKAASFTPAENRFLIATVDWNTITNTLGNLVDVRVFNLTSNDNIQDFTIKLDEKLDPTTLLPGVNFDDNSHGLRGSGTNVLPLHSLVTTLIPGFMSSSDKTKLDTFGVGGTLQTDAQHGARSNKTTGGSAAASPLLHPTGAGDSQPGFSSNSFTDALLSKLNGITAGAKKIHITVITIGAGPGQQIPGTYNVSTGATTGTITASFTTGLFPSGITVVGYASWGQSNISTGAPAGYNNRALIKYNAAPTTNIDLGSSTNPWQMETQNNGVDGSTTAGYLLIGIE